MKLIWYGYFVFKIEIGDIVILIDFFLIGNLMFFVNLSVDKVMEGVGYVVLIYGYDDYIGDVIDILKKNGGMLIVNFEICMWVIC